jgi:hypothetical protein
MLFQGWVNFPIEIVQQTGNPPELGILAKLLRVEPHGSLDCQHMADQIFVFDVLSDDFKGLIAIH